MNLLSQVELVSLDVRKWSGQRKLTETDLGIPEGTMPPEELASLGSIKLITNESIASFEAIKKRARRACTTVGTRFIAGCWAVPLARVQELVEILGLLKAEYESELDVLVRDYDKALDTQCEKFPQWGELIRSKAPGAEVIKAAMSFEYQTFTIGEGQAPQALQSQVASMGGTLSREIEAEAKSIWQSSFEGRAEVGQRALNPMRLLLDKLRSFAWMNPGVAAMAQGLENVLASVPQTGRLIGNDFDKVSGALLLMSSGRFAQHATAMNASLAGTGPVMPQNVTPATPAPQPAAPAPAKVQAPAPAVKPTPKPVVKPASCVEAFV